MREEHWLWESGVCNAAQAVPTRRWPCALEGSRNSNIEKSSYWQMQGSRQGNLGQGTGCVKKERIPRRWRSATEWKSFQPSRCSISTETISRDLVGGGDFLKPKLFALSLSHIRMRSLWNLLAGHQPRKFELPVAGPQPTWEFMWGLRSPAASASYVTGRMCPTWVMSPVRSGQESAGWGWVSAGQVSASQKKEGFRRGRGRRTRKTESGCLTTQTQGHVFLPLCWTTILLGTVIGWQT